MYSIVQIKSAISFVLLSTVLSDPISFGTLDSANIDMAVVVLIVGCVSSRNIETGIGRTAIGGGTTAMDELG